MNLLMNRKYSPKNRKISHFSSEHSYDIPLAIYLPIEISLEQIVMVF